MFVVSLGRQLPLPKPGHAEGSYKVFTHRTSSDCCWGAFCFNSVFLYKCIKHIEMNGAVNWSYINKTKLNCVSQLC